MYRDAREKAGFSREEAAFLLHIGSRTLQNYENDETVPPPDVVLEMAHLYHMPWLTQIYCKECCAIGQVYSYEVLNNIDTSVQSIMLSLRQEVEEAIAVMDKLEKVVRNKKKRMTSRKKSGEIFFNTLVNSLMLSIT